MLYIVHHGTAL